MLDQAACRICLKQTANGPLLRPCKCKGIFAYCHSKCLARWIEVTNIGQCDLCHYKYHTETHKKGILEWLKEDEEEAIDITLVIVFTMFVVYIIFIANILSKTAKGTALIMLYHYQSNLI